MLDTIKYIKSIFPSNWLSKYGKAFENEVFDEFGDAGVNINHPQNHNIELSLVILPKRVGIAILKKNEEELFLDLGGFDYTFEIWEKNKLENFLLNFYNTGQATIEDS